ncbi:MAG: D-alanyl-D-alanine carboxypeptidase family protein [Oligoflexales bacterium]
MDRREAIKKLLDHSTTFAGSTVLIGCCASPILKFDYWGPKKIQTSMKHKHLKTDLGDIGHNHIPKIKNQTISTAQEEQNSHLVHRQRDVARQKMTNFDKVHPGDIILDVKRKETFHSCFRKLQRLCRYIGYGNFNLVSFDEFIYYSKTAPRLEPLNKLELKFFEEMFFFPAEKYGFYGKKLQTSLTGAIPNKEVIKIPFSGHYLYRDVSYPIYQRIKKDVGRSIILTSGIRGVVKQFHLFLAKTIRSDYNLSQASRSLAPPGYSYHSVGDFDVGKKGLGNSNFTNKFSQTDEYKKLIDLGYIDIRYPDDNPFGVRFEPWHIEGKTHRV